MDFNVMINEGLLTWVDLILSLGSDPRFSDSLSKYKMGSLNEDEKTLVFLSPMMTIVICEYWLHK